MSPNSVAPETPLVASPNQTMRVIQVSRKKLYELIKAGRVRSKKVDRIRLVDLNSLNELGDLPSTLSQG